MIDTDAPAPELLQIRRHLNPLYAGARSAAAHAT
jgi:hypothetical protein